MSFNSGPSADQPTLMTDLFDLIEAAIQQGRAIERVDHVAARVAHANQLASLGRVLVWIGEDRTQPAELLVTPEREPGT